MVKCCCGPPKGMGLLKYLGQLEVVPLKLQGHQERVNPEMTRVISA